MEQSPYLDLIVGFQRRKIAEPELRGIQRRLLLGGMTEDDKKIFDALLSFICTRVLWSNLYLNFAGMKT